MNQPLPEKAAQTSAEYPWPIRVLTERIGRYLMRMPVVWAEGQVVELSRRGGSSSVYLTLRDPVVDMSQAVVVRRQIIDSMPDPLTEGARVVARLVPEYFDKRGRFILRAVDIRPVGVGQLLAQIEHLRRLLAVEGLFDEARKQPLPFAPAVVGLICGRGSDAERDVMVNTGRRWPGTRFEIRQVPVQGAGAALAVTAALQELDDHPEVEVIVVARGGGALEDLLPFSNEALVRAAAACRTPVVSAIGHEADTPLLDLVADVRASTPTDAARHIVPDLTQERGDLHQGRRRLRLAQRRHLHLARESLALQQVRLTRLNPARVLADGRRAVADHRDRARRALQHQLRHEVAHRRQLLLRLRALSPQATLDRGYAMVLDRHGRVLADAADTAPGDRLDLVFGRGRAVVTVEDIAEDAAGPAVAGPRVQHDPEETS